MIGWFLEFLSESHSNCCFYALANELSNLLLQHNVGKFAPSNNHIIIISFRAQSHKTQHFQRGKMIKISVFRMFFFKPICIFFLMTPSLASPFTVLHDIQLCPCRADKAVGHQGSSRWRLVTRPWCFLRSSKMLLKWAELTAESFNYFQVTEKCHRQKNCGDLPKGPLFNQPRSLCVHI